MRDSTRSAMGTGRRLALSWSAALATLGLLIATADVGAAAENAGAPAPPCDGHDRTQRPALVIRGLPESIAPDRDIPFLIARARRGSTGAVYRGGASVSTERPLEDTFLAE